MPSRYAQFLLQLMRNCKDYEVKMFDFLPLWLGAFYVMDRGYLDFESLTIFAAQKNHWPVELFFKWIKQYVRIKFFLINARTPSRRQSDATCRPSS
jgi:hypothetical protein